MIYEVLPAGSEVQWRTKSNTTPTNLEWLHREWDELADRKVRRFVVIKAEGRLGLQVKRMLPLLFFKNSNTENMCIIS